MNTEYNWYEPYWIPLPTTPYKSFEYYELRIWRNHTIKETKQFKQLKQALKYYKKHKLIYNEMIGECYIEITKIKPINKYQ